MKGIPSVNVKPPERHKLPSADPDLSGGYGKAWRWDLDALRKVNSNPDDATVVGWIVYAPWAHPLWHSYAFLLVHLRPIEGGTEPPVIAFPGATHEMWLYALNPDFELSNKENLNHLTPANFAAQFKAESDEAAAKRIEQDVLDILAGKLNPDTDARSMWLARYGDNGLKKEYQITHNPNVVGHA